MTDPVTVKVIGNACVAAVRGDIDLTTVDDIARTMTGAGEAKVMILDLSAVNYVDSAGVRLLFQLNRDLAAQSTEVRVVVPRGSHLHRLLDVVELGRAVPVAESVTHALTGINTAPKNPE